ncbi:hypothetical protein [Yersinia sp. 2466 StPb PI]|uniref:hypothetical protein n=1 Tax=Yersinia sp. 2466 StPb PI TaxID=3061648 RepID=UPI0005DDFE32|nr:Uncharacterised protein [Yersinia intermedia]
MCYRIFGNTGLRLSTLALGTGNFGNGWGYGSDKDEARNIYTALTTRTTSSKEEFLVLQKWRPSI